MHVHTYYTLGHRHTTHTHTHTHAHAHTHAHTYTHTHTHAHTQTHTHAHAYTQHTGLSSLGTCSIPSTSRCGLCSQQRTCLFLFWLANDRNKLIASCDVSKQCTFSLGNLWMHIYMHTIQFPQTKQMQIKCSKIIKSCLHTSNSP